MIKEGVFVGKRYEILGRIGSGGMADVYKGKDHKLNRYVAIKVLKSDYRSDETFIKKFVSEAQAAAGLMHPNVVNVYDVGQDRGLYYMVMELVEGITLKDYIEKKGKLSAKETISISIQMVTGIQAAHNRHIIHRDIKPQNIIISKEGKVKVTDFGIARATTSTQTISTSVMGSVHYTSPEQARGGVVDEKSDIYSAGISMYEMVTGHVPFDGDSTVSVALKHLQEEIKSPAEEVPDLPYSLECIIMKCTKKNPLQRYPNCEALLQDLKHSLVDPDGDFVFADAAARKNLDSDRTVVMSAAELDRLKKEQYRSDDDYTDDYDDGDEYEDDYEDDYDDQYDDRYNDDYDDDEEDEAPADRRSRERERERDRERERYETDRRKKQNVNQDTKKIMRILMIVSSVVIALLVLFLVGSAVGVFKNSKNNTTTESTDQVKVPRVLGMTEEEAKAALKKYDLGIDTSTAPSDTVAKGKIISQDPEEGKKVDKHTTVNVVISSGEEAKMTTVPDVEGDDESSAEQAIRAANLIVKKGDSEYSDSVKAGNVISVSPGAGSSVKEGTEVTIVVSLGSKPATVPSLEGKSQSDAEAALSDAGLKGSSTEAYDDNVEAGYVISQDTASGKTVSRGTTISYVVSKGPETKFIAVPSVLGYDQNAAEKKLQQEGLTPSYQGEEYSNEYPAGQVCRQDSSGATVESGTTISYWISSGPEPTTDPDPGDGGDSGDDSGDSQDTGW